MATLNLIWQSSHLHSRLKFFVSKAFSSVIGNCQTKNRFVKTGFAACFLTGLGTAVNISQVKLVR